MDLRKLIITALCLAVSSGVCWQTWRKLRGSGPSVEMFEPEDDEFRELIEAAGETLQKIENFPDSPLIRYALPEELAPKFFPLHHPWNEYDPFAYYVHTSNLDAWRAFPEHPEVVTEHARHAHGLARRQHLLKRDLVELAEVELVVLLVELLEQQELLILVVVAVVEPVDQQTVL